MNDPYHQFSENQLACIRDSRCPELVYVYGSRRLCNMRAVPGELHCDDHMTAYLASTRSAAGLPTHSGREIRSQANRLPLTVAIFLLAALLFAIAIYFKVR